MHVNESIQVLKKFVTKSRYQKMLSVLQNRMKYVSVALENIYQPHNASAVLRSCEAFGVQNVHIIEYNNTFSPNSQVDIGSAQWLSLHHYPQDSISTVYDKMRKEGYRIVATTLRNTECTLYDFDTLKQPSVFVFGHELHGLSQEAVSNADTSLLIPMYGFVESFNISVSAAILLSYVSTEVRNSQVSWNLSPEEQNEVLLTWLHHSVNKAENILERHKTTAPPTITSP